MADEKTEAQPGCTEVAVQTEKAPKKSFGGDEWKNRCKTDAGATSGLLASYTAMGPHDGEKRAPADKFYLAPAIGFFVGMILTFVSFVLYEIGFEVIVVVAIALSLLLAVRRFRPFGDLTDYGNRLMSKERGDAIGIGFAIAVGGVVFVCLVNASMMFVAILWPLMIVVWTAAVAVVRYAKAGDGDAADMVGKIDRTAMIKSMVLSIVLALIACIIVGVVYFCVNYESVFSSSMILNVIIAVIFGTIASWITGWFIANRANERGEPVGDSTLGAANGIAMAIVLVLFTFLAMYISITI